MSIESELIWLREQIERIDLVLFGLCLDIEELKSEARKK